MIRWVLKFFLKNFEILLKYRFLYKQIFVKFLLYVSLKYTPSMLQDIVKKPATLYYTVYTDTLQSRILMDLHIVHKKKHSFLLFIKSIYYIKTIYYF